MSRVWSGELRPWLAGESDPGKGLGVALAAAGLVAVAVVAVVLLLAWGAS